MKADLERRRAQSSVTAFEDTALVLLRALASLGNEGRLTHRPGRPACSDPEGRGSIAISTSASLFSFSMATGAA